jgi:hypothetical protein
MMLWRSPDANHYVQAGGLSDMARVVLAIVGLVLLAGCTSKPSPPAEAAPTFMVTAAPAPVVTVPRTDTLHLLAVPHLVGVLPAGGVEVRTAVPSDSINPRQVPVPAWGLPRPDVAKLVTTLHLWVDVEGVVTNYANPQGGCFWFIGMHLEGESGPLSNLGFSCPAEPGVVPTGVRELVVEMPPIDISDLDGVRLAFTIDTYGAYAPGATIDLLSGTVEHDSTITIDGLQLPLGTHTLVQ